MSEPRPTLKPEYFDALYAADPDPWNFAASPYEQAKYALTLERDAETALSIGARGRMLDRRFDTLACFALRRRPRDRRRSKLRSSRRGADAPILPGVRFEQMFVPEQWPDGVFDLILLSEVVYYLSREDVGRLAARVTRSLAPGRLRDPGPLDRLNGLSPKWRRGRRSLHRTNGIDLRRRAGGSICSNFVWTCCRAPEPSLRRRASERRAIAICSGNSAGLSNRRANSGLRSSMTLHAAPNAELLLTMSSTSPRRDSELAPPILDRAQDVPRHAVVATALAIRRARTPCGTAPRPRRRTPPAPCFGSQGCPRRRPARARLSDRT